MLAGFAWALPVRTRPAITPDQRDDAGRALAALIGRARQQAIADGVRPIPAPVYRALLGYFPSTLLQRCRFAIGRPQALLLPEFGVSYGDATAITLSDVVLFKTEQAAETGLKAWAHELTHVMQCQRWGIDGFASRYVSDSDSVEQEAIDNANRFAIWLPERGIRTAAR